MSNRMTHMKWWGWGDEDKLFDIESKPALWPYIKQAVNLNDEVSDTPPVNINNIALPPARIQNEFLAALHSIPDLIIQMDDQQRLLHAYGKSLRDLWRIRQGILASVPDCVCYPANEDHVLKIMEAASKYNVVIVPFGGGTNIAGCLEVRETRMRMVVSLDMQAMNKVESIDAQSLVAVVQPGIFGPALELALNEAGVTLGHFPDSFEYSTLGGWVATRSAGMQSDQYGKIEDMVIGLRIVTPQGTIATRQVPKSSNGIDIKHICIGSEGILGVITQITLQVHPVPEKKLFYGYLFQEFAEGIAAIEKANRLKCAPSMTRLNDPDKTGLSFAYKSKSNFFNNIVTKLFKWYLTYIKKIDLSHCCLMLVAFEGSEAEIAKKKQKLDAVYASFGGVSLGSSPGESFEKGKYDFPYLRDFALDKGIIADVSETSTLWSNVLPLYENTLNAIQNSLQDKGIKVWCGCHVSHTYHSGASLYFTFAFREPSSKAIEYYDIVKKTAEDAFMQQGATLSHHHAVGYEHMPWLAQDITQTGIEILKGIKKSVDPSSIMNPGKLILTEG